MAKDEEMLEELYELLTLYFELHLPEGRLKDYKSNGLTEPALDRVILREKLYERIMLMLRPQKIHSL